MSPKAPIAALLMALILGGCTAPKPPNILFFLIDDQRNDVLACAGHPFIKTPTVDMLAANGIRFTNAFVTTSICAASRASIFTGLYETKHNYTFGKDPVIEEFVLKSYPYLLKKAGYETGFIGKFGIKIENQDSMLNEMFDFIRMSPRSTPHFITMPDGSRRAGPASCGFARQWFSIGVMHKHGAWPECTGHSIHTRPQG